MIINNLSDLSTIMPTMKKTSPKVLLLPVLFCTGLSAASFIEDANTLRDKNPALLLTKDQPSLSLSCNSRLFDNARVLEFDAMTPFGLFQTFSYTHQMITGNDPYDRTRKVFVSFARNWWNRLGGGLSIGGSSVNSDNGKYTFFNLDLGITWHLFLHPVFGEQITGISLRNALTPSRHNKTWHTLPMDLKLTWLSKLFEGAVQPSFDLNVINMMTDSAALTVNSSIGFGRYPVNFLFLTGNDSLGVSSGFFFTLPKNLEFLFSAQFITDIHSTRSGVLSCRLELDVSGTREERYSRKMGFCTGPSPNDLYIVGINIFIKGNYFDALALFYMLTSEHPDFFKNDWCSYFIGVCYQKLGMERLAENAFNETSARYKREVLHDYINMARLSSANEAIRCNETAGYTRQLLMSHSCDDSLKQEAVFLNAECLLMTDDYPAALNEYQKISGKHPRYQASRYSIAAIYRHQGDSSTAEKFLSGQPKPVRDNSLEKSLKATCPVSVERYAELQKRSGNDMYAVETMLDSLGRSLDLLMKMRQTEMVIIALDSLHELQKELFKPVERYRLVHNPLYKKWRMLGNDLLRYLGKEELELLDRCRAVLDTFD